MFKTGLSELTSSIEPIKWGERHNLTIVRYSYLESGIKVYFRIYCSPETSEPPQLGWLLNSLPVVNTHRA